jgi:ABC-type antimicrobial peptide transport system permease subunit
MEKAVSIPEMFGVTVRPILTYLVNAIGVGDRLVPYSMVMAAGPPWTPADMKDDEIVVNQWLAERLQVKPGDSVELAYFLPESGAALVERTNRLRVHSIVPIEGVYADRTLMPEFPGLAKAESTLDWDAGFPLVHKIGDEDEAYWKKYRGTPKVFVTWAAGSSMWTNRFGQSTAVRLAPSRQESAAGDLANRVATNLLARLSPSVIGLSFQQVRAPALAASSQSQDFGGLFLGFSFFVIIAALILMALLFQFGLEQRATEVGTLLALGFTPAQVRKLLLLEGSVIGLAGGIIGVVGGVGYARAMLLGLATIWRDAIGASTLHFYFTPLTFGVGLMSSVLVCVVTIWLVLRHQARRPARSLLAEGGVEAVGEANRSTGRLARWSALAGILGGVGLVGWALAAGGNSSPGIFFGAGSLLLVGGLAVAAGLLRRLDRAEGKHRMTLSSLGLRGVARRRKRSLASMALLASGSFLIVAVGANRLDSGKEARNRSGGTGGFALIGESTLPVIRDLNTSIGREFYSLNEQNLAGVKFVALRVRDGDEASCLNLNRAQQPRLLGVNPEALSERKAFTFSGVLKGLPENDPWNLLRQHSEDVIPAIGDAASIQWALGRKLGDTLDYTDERGRAFKVRLVGAVANSILQGNLVIDEAEFARRFPGESGHRMFLIDVPSNMPLTNVSAALSRGLQDVGLEVTPATQRLAAFNAVQNTYLNTFQILGGLGLLLGSGGLGVVVLRNVLERRAEFGLLLALGFRQRLLKWLVLSEHGGLLTLGLAIGMTAALVAVLPVLLVPGAKIHSVALMATVGGVLVSGLVWTWLATRLALRGELLEALRSE